MLNYLYICIINFRMMERIVLEVDSSIAKKWKQASAVKRNKLLAFFSSALDLIDEPLGDTVPPKGYGLPDEAIIQQIEAIAKESHIAYEASLDESRKTAKANGLTQEILDRLLNE